MLKIRNSTSLIITKAFAVNVFTASVFLGTTPANALDFTFSFQDVDSTPSPTNGFVTGTLSGLVEGSNPGPGITAEVLSSPGGDLLGTYTHSRRGNAFIVTSGNITFADVVFAQGNNRLFLGISGNFRSQSQLIDTTNPNLNYRDFRNSTTQFSPAAAVPFELNSTVGMATLGLCFGAAKLRRKDLAKKVKVTV